MAATDLRFDKNHLWHPYTSAINPLPCYPVSHAEGVKLYLESGQSLIDGMSSWWSTIHGYNHPAINAAIHAQLKKMSHVMFGGLTHEPATSLGKTLIDMTKNHFDRVFLADSGSVSVEVALKMALQYQHGKGRSNKQKLAALLGGYHGDTLGAMSVCDPVNGMHSLFKETLPKALFLPKPTSLPHQSLNTADRSAIDQFFKEHGNQLAAVIVEPLVQGAGGMHFYSSEYLKALRTYCDEYHVLLIFDEIATGFGRAGELFAFIEADVVPDILCVGKALTGGYMTLAATLCTAQVAEGICQSEAGVFMHGPTFMGNPLACSAANASLKLLNTSPWRQQTQAIAGQLNTELSRCKSLNAVIDVRVKGSIGVVELNQPINIADVQEKFVNLGVWIRPFNRLIYIMPPYIIQQNELSQLTSAIYQVIKQLD